MSSMQNAPQPQLTPPVQSIDIPAGTDLNLLRGKSVEEIGELIRRFRQLPKGDGVAILPQPAEKPARGQKPQPRKRHGSRRYQTHQGR